MLDYIINITINPVFDKYVIEREKQAVYNELLKLMDSSDYEIINKANQLLYLYYGLQQSENSKQQIKNLKYFNYKNRKTIIKITI